MVQTSIDWLIKEILKHDKSFVEFYGAEIEQAKAMHKEEALRFVRTMPTETGVTQEGQSYVQYDAEAHYNNTYNKM